MSELEQSSKFSDGITVKGLAAVGPENVKHLISKIRAIPDFPGKGIHFRDMMPVLTDPKAFAILNEAMIEALPVSADDFDYIGGLESRGFLVGAPMAARLKKGFLCFRKAGKLPPPTLSESYHLEYGQATIEIEEGLIPQGSRVLIVDDLLATGGTASAAARLTQRAGATVAGFSFAVELDGEGGRDKLSLAPVSTLIGME